MTARNRPSNVGSCIRRPLLGMLIAGVLMVACSSSDDGHHPDARADAAFDAATPDDGGSQARGADTRADGSQSPCIPSCTSTQVCCVDQHGHFPRCVDGPECLPLARSTRRTVDNLHDKLAEPKHYVVLNGQDMPEVRNCHWK